MIAKTTLSDVARRVGISASSISRVLSRAHGVNEETRREVLSAVRTMNYQAGAFSREPGRSRPIIPYAGRGARWGVQPELRDKTEDEMIARGDSAQALGALLCRTRAMPFLVVNRIGPETALDDVGADHVKVGLSAANVSHGLYRKGFDRAAPDRRETGELEPAIWDWPQSMGF
jgi:Bacterial regulatory proteins, lacI family